MTSLRSLVMLLVCQSCLCLGCGPSKPTAPPRVHRVSLSELVRAYRTFPSERRYTGLTIQVHVPAEPNRRYHPDRVEAFRIVETRPGCVQFRVDTGSLDPQCDLLVTGVCRGQVRDGVQRSGGIDWYVLVEDCKVTQLRDE